ncbi:MAG: YbaB/EbfC family nucleoid-associated protein [bacterium]
MIFGNMGEMMKMAKDMQGKLKQVKDELSREIYEGSSNGVSAKISGDMELKDITIEPQNDVKRIEKGVKDAVGKALRDAKDGAARKMKGVTGGLGLPGMF